MPTYRDKRTGSLLIFGNGSAQHRNVQRHPDRFEAVENPAEPATPDADSVDAVQTHHDAAVHEAERRVREAYRGAQERPADDDAG